jgi:uncharacterized membrane protein
MQIKRIFLFVMVLFYVIAGINHFVSTPVYRRIVPVYLPFPLVWVYVTGVCEILFGLLLLPFATRHTAAWLIILLLIVLFPANIQMTLNYWHQHNPRLWITILRLPAQGLLIAWAYMYTRPDNPKIAL